MRRPALLLGLAIWLGLLSFLPSRNGLDNPFVRDDLSVVRENPAIRTVAPWTRHFLDRSTFSAEPRFNRLSYRPLVPLTLSLDHALHGLAPRGFRLTNLGLHWLASLLFFFLARRLLERAGEASGSEARVLALVAASLFAVHPLSHFTAQYVTNRNVLLLQVFSQALLLLLVGLPMSDPLPGPAGGEDPRPESPGGSPLSGRVAGIFLLLLLGLLARENAVMLPVTALVLLATVLRKPLGEASTWRLPGAMAVLVLGFLFLRRQLIGMDSIGGAVAGLGFSPGEHLGGLASQVEIQVWEYLRAFLYPSLIRWEPGVPAPWQLSLPRLLSLGVLLLGLEGIRRNWSRRPLVSFCLLAYALPMVPATLLHPFFPVFTRAYGGSPFLFLLVILVPGRWLGSRAMLSLGLVACALLASASRGIAPISSGPERWAHSVRFGSSRNAELHYYLGLRDPNVREEKLRGLLRQIPVFPRARAALGRLLLSRGRVEEAGRELARALEEAPEVPTLWFWNSVVHGLRGESEAQTRCLERMAALEGRPPAPEVLEVLLAALEGKLPALSAALAEYLVSLRDPERDAYHQGLLGYARHLSGDLAGAEAAYLEAWERGYRPALMARNLAVLTIHRGRCDQAVPFLAAADAAHPVTRQLLAACGRALPGPAPGSGDDAVRGASIPLGGPAPGASGSGPRGAGSAGGPGAP